MRNFVVHGGVSGIKSGEGVANQVLVTKAGEEPRFGLSAEVSAEMAKNLGTTNLADLTPSRAAYYLLFTHPSIPERIDAALSAGRPTTA